MSGHILLIGGGEISQGETKTVDDRIKSLAPAGSRLLFFPTAAGDSEGYIETIRQVFGDMFEVVPVTEALGREHAVEALKTGAVVYLGGGRTELLLDLFQKWDLVPALRDLLGRGGIVAGISAGAQALSRAYTDFEAGAAMGTKRGWDFVPVYCLVHAKEDQIEKTLDTYRASGESAALSFVAIGERAAWHIYDGTTEKIGEGPVWIVPAGTLDSGVTAL